jgi:septum formation protein
MRLILASRSPRRKDLLGLLNIPFEVAKPDFAERPDPDATLDPRGQASRFAAGKAHAAASEFPEDLVLSCDTSIELNGKLLGKADSAEEAWAMLESLQGREHFVHSAVALRSLSRNIQHDAIETVRIRMKRLDEVNLGRYIRTGEWTDKAGSYAIQGHGGDLINLIDGDYTAVVGLPLRLVAQLLDPYLSLPVDVESLYRSKPYPNWSRFSP